MHLQTNKPLPSTCVWHIETLFENVYAYIRKANKGIIVMYQSRFVYCFNINQDNVSNAFRLRIFSCVVIVCVCVWEGFWEL